MLEVLFQVRGRGGLGLLDRRPHEVAPLRPRAVVIPKVRVAEEVLQDEPGVRRRSEERRVGKECRSQWMRIMKSMNNMDPMDSKVREYKTLPGRKETLSRLQGD